MILQRRISCTALWLVLLHYCCSTAATAGGRFASWTSTEPRIQPLEWNEFPWQLDVVAPKRSANNIHSYDTLIVCEYANATTHWQQEDDSSSSTSLLSQVLTGLRHELETKTTAGSRSSSVLWKVLDDDPSSAVSSPQRVILVRLVPGANNARKVGSVLAHLLDALPASSGDSGAKPKTRRHHRQQQARCAIVLPSDLAAPHNHSSLKPLSPSSFLNATDWMELTCSLLVGLYQDKRFYGTEKASETDLYKEPRVVDFLFYSTNTATNMDDSPPPLSTMIHIQNELNRGRILAQAIAVCRDVVGAPHNVLNAASLAATAVALTQQYPKTLHCQILDTQECERLGMGALLGVARGSETQAQFIHITYQPRRQPRKRRSSLLRLGIVGKGLLFDTGGYNIKTGTGMTYMKMDCGGAAAVLGAAQAIGALEPDNVEVHFLIAACENMINERAMVPGDILTASNGKTIEIMNTDAEGRLTLADALVYADQQLQCDEIMELSTLTRACVNALGSAVAGMWTHHTDMAEHVLLASQASGEKVWRMPLELEYEEDIRSSHLADLKNMADGHFGGAITAALFLQHFVDRAKFTHVDMAGPVWNYKSNHPTGWGVRFLTEWIYQRNQGS